MRSIPNPFRGNHDTIASLGSITLPSDNADAPLALLAHCPAHAQTPLLQSFDLAQELGLASLCLKDERGRMGLGSFKALGAAYVIAHMANETGKEDVTTALEGTGFVTASAGNHGMSVAAGARLFGAKSVIYLSKSVPPAFAERLREKGAEVRIEGDDYQASMDAASAAAEAESLILLSDSSWSGYVELPHRLMEGYLVMATEIVAQMPEPPTHVFLQAGVGGMAGAVAALFRKAWGDAPLIIVVEPDRAPALIESISAGKPIDTTGPDSNMGRLDCKTPSLIALKGLARDADFFCTLSDQEAADAVALLDQHGVQSTASGVAGLGVIMQRDLAHAFGMDGQSRALVIISEGVDT